MDTVTIRHNKSSDELHTDEYWKTGRLVVHTIGDKAGLMRLDIGLAGFESADDVKQQIKLVIPGETSPLTPVDVTGDNGRFMISFISSDIANAGHVPAEAVVTWEAAGQVQHKQHVQIESAEQVQRTDGLQAVNKPDGDPAVVYPRIIIIMVVVALFAMIAVAMAMLM